MKPPEARPYADPEAAAQKLVELAASVEPINDRIHIEKINGPFLSKIGCKARAGVRRAHQVCDREWLARFA
jgi:hypothetical protein